MEQIQTGIFKGMPFQDYLKIKAVSRSWFKFETPAELRYRLDNPMKATEAMLFGQAHSCMVLEHEEFNKRFRIKVDARTKEGKALKASAEKTGDARGTISEEDHKQLLAMAKVLNAHPLVGPIIDRCEKETTIVWRDDETGLYCKGRIDLWEPEGKSVIDLKSTNSIIRRDLQKQIFDLAYYRQLSWYCEGAQTLGMSPKRAILIFQAKSKGYPVVARQLSQIYLDVARQQNRRDLKIIAECTKSGEWPGYPDEIEVIDIPQWVKNRLNETTVENMEEY